MASWSLNLGNSKNVTYTSILFPQNLLLMAGPSLTHRLLTIAILLYYTEEFVLFDPVNQIRYYIGICEHN